MVETVETIGQETKAKAKASRTVPVVLERDERVEASDASIDEVGVLSTEISRTERCWSKDPRRGKDQKTRWWQRPREEGARVQLLSSFATAETNEQTKVKIRVTKKYHAI